ncbi:hypothetical protein ACM66B_001825 [Microbotryomycetes sp. NB124-2]
MLEKGSPTPSSKPSVVAQNETRREADLYARDADSRVEIFKQRLQTQQHLKAERGIHPVRAGLSVAWQDLSVRGKGSAQEIVYGDTVGSVLLGPFNALRSKAPVPAGSVEEGAAVATVSDAALKRGERFLIHDFNGVLKRGEMLLVLGRPGAGTSTFLKSLAGLTNGYAGVDGRVLYGNAEKKHIRSMQGQIAYVADEEVHLPNLPVGTTIDFALANNTPSEHARALNPDKGTVPSAREYNAQAKSALLDVFGLTHTHGTKVGDAYVRGVSGGERKRVSIVEAMATRASVLLFSRPSRGLDANAALEFTKIMRALADVEQKTIAMSLYQAGNQILDQFDKVLVIAEGEVIYYGPRNRAQSYMEDLGFEMLDGANVADFLTATTSSAERRFRPGFEHTAPRTIADFVERYRQSAIYHQLQDELQRHLRDQDALAQEVTDTLVMTQFEKHRLAFKSQPYSTSFFNQISNSLIREYHQRSRDHTTLIARYASLLINAFIVGSALYQIPDDTSGLFLRGGTVFLTIVVPVILNMSETTSTFAGRPVLHKHKNFSLHRPSALIVAQTIADVVTNFLPIALSTIIIYFLAGLKTEAGPFFIYLLFVSVISVVATSFFRFVGSLFPTFEDASKLSGFAFNLFASYAGYFIPQRKMKAWIGWTRWFNPMFYAFSAMVSSELSGRSFQCDSGRLVPSGPGYDNEQNQACAAVGAGPGATFVDGDTYLDLELSFTTANIWKYFAAVMGLWAAFVILSIVVVEFLPSRGSSRGFLVFKRGPASSITPKYVVEQAEQEKQRSTAQHEKTGSLDGGDDKTADLTSSQSIFTWKSLNYVVRANGQDLKLLDDVQGWCRPGELTALMGSSGAGKTTLLDVLAQRKDVGEVTGEVLINGQALPVSFQRTTGYVEQLDVHSPQATVREALEFSALLRQPRSLSDAQKLAYVDVILDLLELHDIENALVGEPGAGLSVEQRKRLTIGVELVAKPRLIFADEPTSGLDGQSAYTIVRFLRRLAEAGQAVVVVVHQPSASLFAEFDSLLLLKGGGKTVYFGQRAEMPEYFAEHGFRFPRNVNPAEYMIDIVSGDLGRGQDWNKVWLASKQHDRVVEQLEQLKQQNKHLPSTSLDDSYEFASTNMAQLRVVLRRANVQIFRDSSYVTNKVALHIATGLLNGLSFLQLGNTLTDMQSRVFTIFGFIFVAPGVIAQLQPKFIRNRDLYEKREKSAKFYTWVAFILSEIIAEMPYLLVCGLIYFVVWWPVVGFSFRPSVAGPAILEVWLYEFLYTGLGQSIAAYAPNATVAGMINPLVIGTLVLFNGAFIPYKQIQAFWRYWFYYLDPFRYLLGAFSVFGLWDEPVRCSAEEFARVVPPAGQTCGQYLGAFLSQAPGYIVNPEATDVCEYCPFSLGSQFLRMLNYPRKVYGWRDICITLLFVLAMYGFVFVFMSLRTKRTKKAKAQ